MFVSHLQHCLPNQVQIQINDFIKTTEAMTSAVARGIFSAVSSHVVEAWPSILFQGVHFAFPTLMTTLSLSDYGFLFPFIPNFLFFCYTDTEMKFQMIQFIATAAIVTELALNILFPPSLGVYLTVRIIVHTASLIGNGHSIYKGGCKIHQTLTDSQLETSKKVEIAVSGLISVGFGVLGLNTTAKNANKLYEGLKVYQKLDSTQQFFALKFSSIETLGETKSQNAVIIYGFSGEWAEEGNYYFDNTTMQPGYVISKNYNTRSYYVNSSQDLKSVLKQAKLELGADLDLIAVMGHANNQSMKLNENYYFTGNKKEINAIKNTLSSNGDLLLWGCETAKLNRFSNCLTKYISNCLPNVSVTGYDQELTPLYSWMWFNDNKLHSHAWDWRKTYWDSIIAVYQKGVRVS